MTPRKFYTLSEKLKTSVSLRFKTAFFGARDKFEIILKFSWNIPRIKYIL